MIRDTLEHPYFSKFESGESRDTTYCTPFEYVCSLLREGDARKDFYSKANQCHARVRLLITEHHTLWKRGYPLPHALIVFERVSRISPLPEPSSRGFSVVFIARVPCCKRRSEKGNGYRYPYTHIIQQTTRFGVSR